MSEGGEKQGEIIELISGAGLEALEPDILAKKGANDAFLSQLDQDIDEVARAVAQSLTGDADASNTTVDKPAILADFKRKKALEKLARMEKLGVTRRGLKKTTERVKAPKLKLVGETSNDFSPKTDPAVVGAKFRKKLLLVSDHGVSVNRSKKKGPPNKVPEHANATFGKESLGLHKEEVYKVNILWEEILAVARKRKAKEKMLEAHDVFNVLEASPNVARSIRQMCLVGDESRRQHGRKKMFELADEIVKLMRAGKTKMAYNVVAYTVLVKS